MTQTSAHRTMSWTVAQRQAIEADGLGVLVSAGAGSGKTAVLAERCARLAEQVEGGRPRYPIEGLLVVTFTEAAATQMRERIARVLRQRLSLAPADTVLQRQLALLDVAQISTIHSFCKRTLEQHFALAGVDPVLTLLDGAEAKLLRREAATQVFDRMGDRRGAAGEAFLDLVESYGCGREETLVDRVLTISDFLTSVVDPERWMKDALAAYGPGPKDELSPLWAERLRVRLHQELAAQIGVLDVELAALPQSQGAAGCRDAFATYRATLEEWQARLQRGDDSAIDAVCLQGIGAYQFPDPPKKSKARDAAIGGDTDAFERAAGRWREIKKKLFKEGLQADFGRFSSQEWAAGIAAARRRVKTFLTVVKMARSEYRRAKRDLGVVDFSDLERLTLDLLQKEPAVARRLRDRFHHVMVDEFQDTNPVQAELLRLVSREDDPEHPANLFTVGDVKQSIYRFRLAEPQLFLARQQQFRAAAGVAQARGVAIDLRENFRSRTVVLDAINALFRRLMGADLGKIAYDERAELKSGRADAEGGVLPAIELHVLEADGALQGDGDDEQPESAVAAEDTPKASRASAFDWERIEREAYLIGRCIQQLVSSGQPPSTSSPASSIAYRDIVILLRSVSDRGPLFVRTLSRMGIPVFADVAGGFFESLEIGDMLSVLSLMDNQQQDIPLASVLRSPIFGPPLTDSELVKIRTEGGDWGRAMPFHAAVNRYAREGTDESLRARIAAVLHQLNDWRQRAIRRPLADVVWEIYDETGYLAYVSGLREGLQRRANLIELHERARQFDKFHRHGLYRFLRFIEELRTAEEDWEPGTVVAEGADVVRVMSIHKSKGLEFPVVIVGELGKIFNMADARGTILFDRRLGLGLEGVDVERRFIYPTLPHRLVRGAGEEETLAEELRVLYVALTRAMERLILVGSASIDNLREIRVRSSPAAGLLPLLTRRKARSVLDWLWAAICCQEAGIVSWDWEGHAPTSGTWPAASLFGVRTYDAAEIGAWELHRPEAPNVTAWLERCQRLEPLPETMDISTEDELMRLVRRRLTAPRPAAALGRVPASVAASELKSRWQELAGEEEEPATEWSAAAHVASNLSPGQQAQSLKPPAKEGPGGMLDRAPQAAKLTFAPVLEKPQFIVRPAAEPTRRGTVTHAFLEHVDLQQPCDEAGLLAQLQTWAAATGLCQQDTAEIDVPALAWFFNTELGKRLCGGQTRHHREWPFVMRVDPRRYDAGAAPLDQGDMILVQGVIDCLFDTGQGWEILDYKTDRVEGLELDVRAALYRGQLSIYADAVTATWGRAVERRWLVFLAARQIREV